MGCINDVRCEISILTTMEMVHKASENFSAQIMTNCFRTSGFIADKQNIGRDISIQGKEVEGLLNTWNRPEVIVSFEEYFHFDDNVPTSGTLLTKKLYNLLRPINTILTMMTKKRRQR